MAYTRDSGAFASETGVSDFHKENEKLRKFEEDKTFGCIEHFTTLISFSLRH